MAFGIWFLEYDDFLRGDGGLAMRFDDEISAMKDLPSGKPLAIVKLPPATIESSYGGPTWKYNFISVSEDVFGEIDALNYLGESGWEMVGFVPVGLPRFMFKRRGN